MAPEKLTQAQADQLSDEEFIKAWQNGDIQTPFTFRFVILEDATDSALRSFFQSAPSPQSDNPDNNQGKEVSQ